MHLNFSLVLIPLFLAIQHAHAAPLDTSPSDKDSPLILRQVQWNTIACISGTLNARTCVRQGCAPNCGPNGFCADPDSGSSTSTQTNVGTGSGSETCDASSEFCSEPNTTTAQCSGAACDPADSAFCGAGCTCQGFFSDSSITGRSTTYACA